MYKTRDTRFAEVGVPEDVILAVNGGVSEDVGRISIDSLKMFRYV
jgi:hypothetical protein